MYPFNWTYTGPLPFVTWWAYSKLYNSSSCYLLKENHPFLSTFLGFCINVPPSSLSESSVVVTWIQLHAFNEVRNAAMMPLNSRIATLLHFLDLTSELLIDSVRKFELDLSQHSLPQHAQGFAFSSICWMKWKKFSLREFW